jgi:hypothetical protein
VRERWERESERRGGGEGIERVRERDRRDGLVVVVESETGGEGV